MFQFFLFVMIICTAIWGSATVFTILGRISRKVDPGNQADLIAALRDEVEYLTARVGRVEEDLDFFKELKAPSGPGVSGRLKAPEESES